MIGRRRLWRSFDDALAVVSPLAFADSVESYLTGLPQDELRPLVLRSIKRMNPGDRAQFALFLGHDAPNAQIDEVGGPALAHRELHALVESCDDLLPNRFAAFLRENPRAVASLGADAQDVIFQKLQEGGNAAELAREKHKQSRVPAGLAALAGLTLVVALLPLGAQYLHQRGMIAGLSQISIVPQAPVPPPAQEHVAAVPKVPQHSRAPQPKVAARRPHAQLGAHPPVRIASETRPHAKRAVHHNAVPIRHLALWKFDPSQNPYTRGRTRGRAWVAPSRAPAHAVAASGFAGRAQLVVQSYLNAVIAGDTPAALRHLGLPADANSSNITEAAIVTRDTRAQIVGTKASPDGKTRVQVDLSGRRGEYFEVFEIAHDGPAVRIADRYYIPVNRTAEELSARLLAKNTH